MPRELSAAETAAVAALSPGRRVGYCVGQAAGSLQLWTLRTADGWVVARTDDGPVLPVWPHPDYAAACAAGGWAGAEPVALPLADVLAAWPVGAKGDGRAVMVFPRLAADGEPEGVVLPAERFAALLRQELA